MIASALRHIKLLNTPEQKPITNSRDTQELHYEAGCEVLQIFLDYQTRSKTSLLQDFAYYEVRSPFPHLCDIQGLIVDIGVQSGKRKRS